MSINPGSLLAGPEKSLHECLVEHCRRVVDELHCLGMMDGLDRV